MLNDSEIDMSGDQYGVNQFNYCSLLVTWPIDQWLSHRIYHRPTSPKRVSFV